MSNYNFKITEKKWQKYWEDKQLFKTNISSHSKKYYVLEMFMYPSGKIHMGHVRNYTIGDVVARYKRLQGFNVLHPMGFDAFGLPAENAAFEHKIHPKDWTYKNMETMKTQLKAFGFSYDWSTEIATCSPDYYKHQQRLFIEMYNKGLVYKKDSVVNWDPVDNCVLSNEQVIDGKGWRSGAVVEKKHLQQWFFKITQYQEELLQDLDLLNGWPEKVKTMQSNWIGKSYGAVIKFKCIGKGDVIEVFSTRPETIFGAVCIAISTDHAVALVLSLENDAINKFIKKYSTGGTSNAVLETQEKDGIFTGLYVEHPFIKGKQLPVYIANFVLGNYGKGAIFCTPAHDKRDYEFAETMNLPVIDVISVPKDSNPQNMPLYELDSDLGTMINSDFLNGLNVKDARKLVIEKFEETNTGSRKIFYKLRDWGISRQRYWGCPIPIITCPKCGDVPVNVEDLPVELPYNVSFDVIGNPLSLAEDWYKCRCPKCGGEAKRDTDTMDTFVDSSWYYARFVDSKNVIDPFNKSCAEKWLPVNQYVGGIEHAVLHLLYARFFFKVLRDLGYHKCDEPFVNLLTQGMVCHPIYKNEKGDYIFPCDVQIDGNGDYLDKDGNKVIVLKSQKMSKSKKNVIDPDKIINDYGVDTVRVFILSDVPPEKDLDWSEENLDGCYKFVNRVYRLVEDFRNFHDVSGVIDIKNLNPNEKRLLIVLHKAMKNIKYSYDNLLLNKVVAFIRELVNTIYEAVNSNVDANVIKYTLRNLLIMMSPIMPHLADECSEMLGYKAVTECNEQFPEYDNSLIDDNVIQLPVQVNGKMRALVNVKKGLSNDEIIDVILQSGLIEKYVNDKTMIKKAIIIPGKIVNLII